MAGNAKIACDEDVGGPICPSLLALAKAAAKGRTAARMPARELSWRLHRNWWVEVLKTPRGIRVKVGASYQVLRHWPLDGDTVQVRVGRGVNTVVLMGDQWQWAEAPKARSKKETI